MIKLETGLAAFSSLMLNVGICFFGAAIIDDPTFLIVILMPILLSYVTLPLARRVKSDQVKAALWWPFIDYRASK